jgi:Uma2 family endonuclease
LKARRRSSSKSSRRPSRTSIARSRARRYAAYGVERYWLVDPVARRLDCLRLTEGFYAATAPGTGDATLAVPDVPALQVDLQRLSLPRFRA